MARPGGAGPQLWRANDDDARPCVDAIYRGNSQVARSNVALCETVGRTLGGILTFHTGVIVSTRIARQPERPEDIRNAAPIYASPAPLVASSTVATRGGVSRGMWQAKTTIDKIETILSYLKTTIEPCQKSALSQAGGGPFLRLSHGGPPPPRTLYARSRRAVGGLSTLY